MDIFTVVITQPDGIEKDIFSMTRLKEAIDKVVERYKEIHEVDLKIVVIELAANLQENGYYKTAHEDGTVYEILESHID